VKSPRAGGKLPISWRVRSVLRDPPVHRLEPLRTRVLQQRGHGVRAKGIVVVEIDEPTAARQPVALVSRKRCGGEPPLAVGPLVAVRQIHEADARIARRP
jgi:hypothetical protein